MSIFTDHSAASSRAQVERGDHNPLNTNLVDVQGSSTQIDVSAYNLHSKAEKQLANLFDMLQPGSKENLLEALQHPKLDGQSRAEMIGSLHDMLSSPRHNSIQSMDVRLELVNATLAAIAHPLSGHQSNRKTCTIITDIETRLTMQDPAEAVRLIAELTSDTGVATLASGKEMRFLPASLLPDRGANGERINSRSIFSRVLQSASMQYAAGYELTSTGKLRFEYDVENDVTIDNLGGTGYGGLFGDKLQRLSNDVFDHGSTRLDSALVGNETATGKATYLMNKIHQQLLRGEPVTTEMNWSPSGSDHAQHELLVLKIEDGVVHFKNGWRRFEKMAPSHQTYDTAAGRIECMSVADYSERLRSAYIVDKSVTANEAKLTELSADRKYNETLRATKPQIARIAPPHDSFSLDSKSDLGVQHTATQTFLEQEIELKYATVPNLSVEEKAQASSTAAGAAHSQRSLNKRDEELF